MKKKLHVQIIVFSISFLFTISCFQSFAEQKEPKMKVLNIEWQRLVDEKGQTCQRCGATEKEVQKAFESLKQSLSPLGIEVTLEKKAIDPSTCAKDVLQSNRIWIGGRTLEEWLNAQIGKSPCGFCCEELGNEVECRTVEIEGQVYEAIPANIIVQAGLLAASGLMKTEVSGISYCEPEVKKSSKEKPCCP